MKLAFVFPGQGSQSVGMLADLAEHYPQVQATFAEASEVLGYDLWNLLQNGPEEQLNQTDKTQPAMLAAGIAVWRAWQSTQPTDVNFVAGHSLGEYSALVAAEALSFQDAIKLVELRGQLMQQAVPAGEGAMAAILGLDDDVVRAVCNDASAHGVVEAVNFNSPGQVVIAGASAAVNAAIELATEQGAKRALLLPVSVPSHCALMKPAAEKLAAVLAEITINTPKIPVIHNTSVGTADNADAIRELLTEQLYRPVRWVETIQYFAAENVEHVVECGPGKVLAGLNKRIDKTLPASPLFDAASFEKLAQTIGDDA
jgi:[acyl-carrier-protein] S-malonyltransferase